MFQDLTGLMQRVRFEIWDEADVDVIVRVPVTELRRLPPPPPPPSEPRRQLQHIGGWGTMTPIRWLVTGHDQLVPAARSRAAMEERIRAAHERRAAREAMEDATPRWQRTV